MPTQKPTEITVRNNLTEAWLDKEHISYRFIGDIPMDKINTRLSDENHARFVARDDGLVTTYGLNMLDGDAFPPIVVYEKDGFYVVIDGNHRRWAAMEIKATHIPAYLVENKDEFVLEVLTLTANFKTNGDRPKLEEGINSAMFMVNKYDRTALEMGRRYGISPVKISDALRIADVRRRLAEHGISSADMKKDILERLHAIYSDTILVDAVDTIVKGDLSATQVSQLVPEIRRHRTEADQLAYLASYRDTQEFKDRMAAKVKGPNKRGRHGNSQRTQFFSHLGALKKDLERFPTMEQMGLTREDDRKRVIVDTVQIVRRMEALVGIQATNWIEQAHSGNSR